MKSRTRAGAAALACAAAGALALPALGDAAAGSSISATVSVAQAVRSVTVSASSENLNNCFASASAYNAAVGGTTSAAPPAGTSSALSLPNGFCTSPSYTVTNGSASSHIEVGSTNGTATGGTGNWTLVSGGTTPGTDQFAMDTLTSFSDAGTPTGYATSMSNSPNCDSTFDYTADQTSGCSASAGQTATEWLGIDGPTAQGNGDTATGQTATVNWTAVP